MDGVRHLACFLFRHLHFERHAPPPLPMPQGNEHLLHKIKRKQSAAAAATNGTASTTSTLPRESSVKRNRQKCPKYEKNTIEDGTEAVRDGGTGWTISLLPQYHLFLDNGLVVL